MPKKQKSGLYRTKVTIGVKADGKPLYKWISGKTKKDLEQERRKVEEFYISGTGLRDDKLFGEYATEWYKTHKEPFLAPSSQCSFRSMLNKHILPAFADRNLRAIHSSDLQAFMNRFAGTSKTHISVAISVFRGIFGIAHTDRLVLTDPSQGLKRPEPAPQEDKRALTEAERANMVALFSLHTHGLYLAAMYYTGVRPGEARGLKWGDFDFKAGMLHVQRDIDFHAPGYPEGDLKTPAADRYIPIATELRALLWPRRGLPDVFLFTMPDGRPLTQYFAWEWWLELMIALKMAHPKTKVERKYRISGLRDKYVPEITPHTMRHNFITMCWENGIDVMLVMKMVGHKDSRTTLNIYTHLSRAQMESAQGKLDGMFEKKVAKKLHDGEK